MLRELRKAGLDFTAKRVDRRADFVAALETFMPDVLLADCKLPGFSGAEALAYVRHVHPEIPVVIVTGTLGDEAAIELLKAGAKDYVLKGNLLRLPSAVERAITVEQGIRARKLPKRRCAPPTPCCSTTERLAHIGGFDWDIASGKILWSEETYRMLGVAPGEFVPTIPHFVDCIHPDDRRRMQDAIDASVTRNEPFDIEFRILRPDKIERSIQVRGEIVRDEAGQPIRMTGTSHDITERKRAEAQIREDEAKFRSLVEQNVAGVAIIRQDGTVGYINPYFAALIGWAQAEVTGRRFFDFIPETEQPIVANHLRSADFGQRRLSPGRVRDGETGTAALSTSSSMRRRRSSRGSRPRSGW